MKEAWKRQRDGSNTSTWFIVLEGVLQQGTPSRQMESTAAYRLGVDIGEHLEVKPLWVGKFFQSAINHH
jgi:hypothetical protein